MSDRSRVPVVAFVGWAGSGKTTLLEGVVTALRGQGLRVAVVKHAHHPLQLDGLGTDSARLVAAGATPVLVVGAGQELLLKVRVPAGQEPSLLEVVDELILTWPGDAQAPQLVLAEGFKQARGVSKIEVRARCDDEPCVAPEERLALVCDTGGDFRRTDSGMLANFLIAQLGLIGPPAVHELPGGPMDRLIEEALAVHGHHCPGQVLGVRMGLLGCSLVGISRPRDSRDLLVWLEIDRCAADAIQTVTGCRPGKRTLKLVDYGKLAATFVNQHTGVAYRIAARPDSREAARTLSLESTDRYAAQAAAYRSLPDEALFWVERVQVDVPRTDLPGPPVSRVECSRCREEVNDGREVFPTGGDGAAFCRPCAGEGTYYRPFA